MNMNFINCAKLFFSKIQPDICKTPSLFSLYQLLLWFQQSGLNQELSDQAPNDIAFVEMFKFVLQIGLASQKGTQIIESVCKMTKQQAQTLKPIFVIQTELQVNSLLQITEIAKIQQSNILRQKLKEKTNQLVLREQQLMKLRQQYLKRVMTTDDQIECAVKARTNYLQQQRNLNRIQNQNCINQKNRIIKELELQIDKLQIQSKQQQLAHDSHYKNSQIKIKSTQSKCKQLLQHLHQAELQIMNLKENNKLERKKTFYNLEQKTQNILKQDFNQLSQQIKSFQQKIAKIGRIIQSAESYRNDQTYRQALFKIKCVINKQLNVESPESSASPFKCQKQKKQQVSVNQFQLSLGQQCRRMQIRQCIMRINTNKNLQKELRHSNQIRINQIIKIINQVK